MHDPAHQTAPSGGYAATDVALGDDLEAVMADGTHDLAGIVAALNARAGGPQQRWTAESLVARLSLLANG